MSAHGGATATSKMYAGNGCLREVAKLASTAEIGAKLPLVRCNIMICFGQQTN